MEKALEENPSPNRPPTHSLVQLACFVLKLNFLRFNDKVYHQCRGIAMGTKMAPTLANIFMTHLETALFDSAPSQYKPFFYKRFIDDAFAIFSISRHNILSFISYANSFHPSIKFTFELSRKRVNFLDTTVSINRNGYLSTSLYFKKTDTFQYLSMDSCHPTHCKKAIPYSQALRIIRICSETQDATFHLRNLYSRLLKRGYDHHLLHTQFNRATSRDRQSLLTPRDKVTLKRVPLVITHNPRLPPLNNLINNHFHLLKEDTHLKPCFEFPPLAAYRQPPNLRRILISAKLPPLRTVHSKCNCLCCKSMVVKSTIHSFANRKSFPIASDLSCKSSNLIYLIECVLCKQQYVGETSLKLQQRFAHHRSDTKLNKPTSVSLHFNSPNHHFGLARITPLWQCETFDTPYQTATNRKKMEQTWIYKLKSFFPHGLNHFCN